MAKTPAERKRIQREKLKEKGEYEQFQIKDAERKRKRREMMSNDEKEAVRAKDRERKASSKKQKIASGVVETNPFKSPQALGKAEKG